PVLAASTSCIFLTPRPTGWSSLTPLVNLIVRSANCANDDVATSKAAAARARVLRLNMVVSLYINDRGWEREITGNSSHEPFQRFSHDGREKHEKEQHAELRHEKGQYALEGVIHADFGNAADHVEHRTYRRR